MKQQLKKHAITAYFIVTVLGAYSAAIFYLGTQYHTTTIVQYERASIATATASK